jgi:XTP/dITP diphosphohydrolase
LGDVLLHVAFYAKIASEKGAFDIKDVCDRLCDKLIFRHPHVFGTVEVDNATQVSENWEQLKLREKGGNKRVLSGVPSGLPSIVKAYRIQEKARNVGFEWDDASGAWEKLLEEIEELKAELERGNRDLAEEELGDMLFAAINVARMNGLSPDNALERTNQKFIRRFNYVEEGAIAQGQSLKEMTLEAMDALWDEAKSKGL